MKYNDKWHQVGLLFFNYHNDARSNKRKIKLFLWAMNRVWRYAPRYGPHTSLFVSPCLNRLSFRFFTSSTKFVRHLVFSKKNCVSFRPQAKTLEILNIIHVRTAMNNSVSNTKKWIIREISSFRCEVYLNCALLGYYAGISGNFLPTFRDNVSVLNSRIKILDIL